MTEGRQNKRGAQAAGEGNTRYGTHLSSQMEEEWMRVGREHHISTLGSTHAYSHHQNLFLNEEMERSR